jgi:hypothetical protein
MRGSRNCKKSSSFSGVHCVSSSACVGLKKGAALAVSNVVRRSNCVVKRGCCILAYISMSSYSSLINEDRIFFRIS